MYAHRSSHGPVDLAFTDRHGGVGAAVLDDFAAGDPVAQLRQVHGNDVVVVTGSSLAGVVGAGEVVEPPAGDALVTAEPGVVLAVRVADCVPVLLADAEAGVVAAAHAGRLGVVAGVVPATVEVMRDLGARELTAWVGPHVCGSCYEVPAELREEVAVVEPATRSTTSSGTPGLDLGAGVRSQLERAGVAVVDLARCTLESPDLFSYRREGVAAGRFAGLVRRRA